MEMKDGMQVVSSLDFKGFDIFVAEVEPETGAAKGGQSRGPLTQSLGQYSTVLYLVGTVQEIIVGTALVHGQSISSPVVSPFFSLSFVVAVPPLVFTFPCVHKVFALMQQLMGTLSLTCT